MDVRDHIQSILSTPKKSKTPKKNKTDQAAVLANGQQGHDDYGTYLFELLESVVLEIGVENVVQVITDTRASYVYAGRLLMWRSLVIQEDNLKHMLAHSDRFWKYAHEAVSMVDGDMPAIGDWWASYGYEIPTLQSGGGAAARILSQPCSSL
ncbi:hypothetical protein AHAS_Ahas15G0095200 [Arachis hypogaea]